MGLFGKLFGSGEKEGKEEKEALPWQQITRLDQLDVIAKRSKTKNNLCQNSVSLFHTETEEHT